MSASSFRHVLALLDDDAAEAMWGVLDRAVELADAEHARLTLATTTDPGPVVSWVLPLAVIAGAIPIAEERLQAEAGDRLAQAAEFVPASIPLTTVLLGRDTAKGLSQLLHSGRHDLLIVRHRLVAHRRTLRRTIRTLGIATLAVSAEPVAQSRLLSRKAFRPRPATQT